MFAVEWLKQGVTVERETSALANLADAVATARARAEAVVARHPRDEPDSFRLVDSSGAVLILSSSLPGGGSRKRKATTPSGPQTLARNDLARCLPVSIVSSEGYIAGDGAQPFAAQNVMSRNPTL